MGQGRVRIKCKKPHITKDREVTIDKLQGIPNLPATQNIYKNRTDFPMHEQSLSNFKTEAIT